MESQTDQTAKAIEQPKWVYHTGYLLLTLSFIVFLVVDHFEMRREGEGFTFFFLHYLLAVGYAIALLSSNSLGVRTSWRKENIHKTIILLNLFLISAYGLNRVLPVFEDSTDWFSLFIFLTSGAILSYRYFNSLPKWINIIQHVLIGCAILLYTYYSIYVANFYILGSLGTLAFGIGAHIFVPIFLLIGSIVLIRHTTKPGTISNYWIGFGCLIVLAITGAFIIEWNLRISTIDRIANQSVLNSDVDLPEWVTIAESVENDWIGERILKSSLVYTVSNQTFQWDLFPTRATWDERKKHDPLVFVASLFSRCSLPDETRIKILQSITDNRHRAQERLWSGDNLTTSYVVSDVDIYPDLRLAYTEKYLNVRNNTTRKGWWGSTEEAIYTFQLPEGSVVTSLSLWISGKEEKSILTSKQKAARAYSTIVGKEARDPSVLHWQEGNTVSVRIFPCTQKEERKFKVGITSPLPEMDDKVIYKNITFRGPNPEKAKEAVRIRFIGQPSELALSPTFKKNKKGEYFLEHNYDPDLTITFSAGPIESNQFSFDGFTYSLLPYKQQFQTARFSKIFLDLNNSWSQLEMTELRSLVNEREVYVYTDNEFIKLTNDNWNEVTAELLSRNFSLFPFHRVSDLAHSLVISKGKELSPHLKDFASSNFAKSVGNYFAENNKINLYNLPGGVSTYVSTFRELRGLEFAEGNVGNLKNLLQSNQFPIADESETKVILHDSKMTIKRIRSDSAMKDNAPDHLARLFAYNDIMRRVGASYFKDDFINDDLIDEAATAYVVSPVSSLIVLEAKEDYDRFGIKDKDNSLHNASKQSSGAVPEPHEWALIIVFATLVLFTTVRKYKFKPQQ